MTLEELVVQLKANNEQFKKTMKDARKTALDSAEKIDNALDSMGKNAGQKAKTSLEKTLDKTRSLRDELKKINEAAKKDIGVKPSDSFKKVQAQIQAVESELEKLHKKAQNQKLRLDMTGAEGDKAAAGRKNALKKLNELQAEQTERYGQNPDKSPSKGSREWNKLQNDIDKTIAQIERYDQQLAKINAKDYAQSEEWNRTQEEIAEATRALEAYEQKADNLRTLGADKSNMPSGKRMAFLREAFAGDNALPAGLKKLSGLLHAVGETGSGMAAGMGKVGKVMAKAGSGVKGMVGWLKKLHTGFGKVLSKIPLLGKLSGTLSKMKRGLSTGLGLSGLLKLGGIGYGVMAAVRGMKEGLGNLAQYSGSTQTALNSLTGSLQTMKNAFATAFAPILDMVAPILAKLIDWCTAAATAVAQLFSALTGRKTAVIARKATSGISSGISGVGSSADKAKGSVDDLKRSLMGFDQINKLDDNSSSGGGSGGGGGGGGAAGAGSMFDTVEIGSEAMNLADAIKEAWANADFTELGVMVGEKLNEALLKINWTKIQETSRKIAKSIATFLNGFIQGTDWNLVGQTIAEGINTAIYFAQTFVTTFNWSEFGKAIGNTINGFVKKIDWAALGNTISTTLSGLFTTAARALETIDWSAIGKGLVTTVRNIEWGKIASSMFEMLGAAIGGAASLLWTVLAEIGKDIAAGLKDGILNATSGIGTWISDNIFTPFINGIKKAFGIASPAKTMKPIGENILQGLLEGIKNKKDDLVQWFKDLPTTIKNSVGNLDIVATVKGVKDKTFTSVKEAFEGLKNSTAVKTISGATAKAFTTVKQTFEAIKSSTAVKTITAAKAKAWDSVKKTWDSIKSSTAVKTIKASITGMNAKLKKFFGLKASGGVYSGGRWHPVTAYAAGGAPDMGQVFVAREAGPELVGTIGGHTAVMNNNQIVSSVAAGVAQAVAQVLGSGAGGTEVHVHLDGDARKMFKVMRTEAQNYTNSTGKPAFPI